MIKIKLEELKSKLEELRSDIEELKIYIEQFKSDTDLFDIADEDFINKFKDGIFDEFRYRINPIVSEFNNLCIDDVDICDNRKDFYNELIDEIIDALEEISTYNFDDDISKELEYVLSLFDKKYKLSRRKDLGVLTRKQKEILYLKEYVEELIINDKNLIVDMISLSKLCKAKFPCNDYINTRNLKNIVREIVENCNE